MKITNKTKLKKILEIKGAEKILLKHNFPCVSCPMAKMEMDVLDIKTVCSMYGLDEKKIIDDLNKIGR